MFQNLERIIEFYGEEKANELAALMNSACEILKVSHPEIWFHDHVAVRPTSDFAKEVVSGDGYKGRNYMRDASKFGVVPVIGVHGFKPDGNCSIKVSLRDINDELRPLNHVLFTVLHELRHSWQHEYGFDDKNKDYYNLGDDVHKYLNHPAEIDADAFSALILEQCTEYRPHLTCRDINMRFDKKRMKRMKELKKEYFPYVPKNQRST